MRRVSCATDPKLSQDMTGTMVRRKQGPAMQMTRQHRHVRDLFRVATELNCERQFPGGVPGAAWG